MKVDQSQVQRAQVASVGLEAQFQEWRPRFLPLSSFAYYMDDVSGEGEGWLGSLGPGLPSVK